MFDLKGAGWMLWQGLALTVEFGLAAMAVALLLGLLSAWGRLTSAVPARVALEAAICSHGRRGCAKLAGLIHSKTVLDQYSTY